jgi:hypothetical protein
MGIHKLPLVPFFLTVAATDFATFTEDRLLPACEVLFVGYPNDVYDQVNNLPVIRAGKIASMPKVDFNGKPEFLIDAHVWPGSSGSPVFARVYDRYRLVGMLGQAPS